MGVCGSIPHTPTKLALLLLVVAVACGCEATRSYETVAGRAHLDRVLRDRGIELVMATGAITELDTRACAATTDAQCLRCTLAPATMEIAAEQLALALDAAPVSFSQAAGLRRVVICSQLAYVGDHGPAPGGTADLAGGAVFVQTTALAGSARAVIQHELFHLFDLQRPARDAGWLALNPPGFRYGDRAASGFARAYGMTSIREDKATIFEALIERDLCGLGDPIVSAKARLIRQRIGEAIGVDARFLDEAAPCLTTGAADHE